ncbi:hypothetical protein [Paucibacter soli]|uniref:hypothetical protein n=1 Tax=Paucibacter soli TaxID=3133433 RepID=UPI0030B45376
MRTTWRFTPLALGLLCLTMGTAQAQSVVQDPAVAQTLQCLTRKAEPPRLPRNDERRGHTGFVRVKLDFDSPTRPPKVEILARGATPAMVDEVERYLDGYRLPCMAEGQATLSVVQEFSFKPQSGIQWTYLRHVRREATGALECLRTPPEHPEFPRYWFDRNAGSVVVQARFTAADQAPELSVVYESESVNRAARNIVLDYVSRYRLPCMSASAEPVAMQQQFKFAPVGRRHSVFKDELPLVGFLSAMEGIEKERVHFDFGTMACPFRVAWRLGRPALPNAVGEIGAPDPNRLEFLSWLETLTLKLRPGQFEDLLGSQTVVLVPCGVLSLEPAATADAPS